MTINLLDFVPSELLQLPRSERPAVTQEGRASIEHTLIPTSEAFVAIKDRDAGLWALLENLSVGDTLALGYRFSRNSPNNLIHARIRFAAAGQSALDERSNQLDRSLKLAMACAFPDFVSEQCRLKPFFRQFPLCPPNVAINSDHDTTKSILLPRIAEKRPSNPSKKTTLLLPQLPQNNVGLDQALVVLSKTNSDAELTIKLSHVSLNAAEIRVVEKMQQSLLMRSADPRLDHKELALLDGQQALLSKWSETPNATKIVFALGLPDKYEPLLPSLICRLLFGGQRTQNTDHSLDLSTAFHIPSKTTKLTPNVTTLHLLNFSRLRRPANQPTSNGQITIGKFANGAAATIGARDLKRHLYLIGATGVGKSTLISDMIRQDIEAGRNVVVIDPHGDLYGDILDDISTSALKRTTLANVSDFAHPFTINLLEIQNGPGAAVQRNYVCNQLIGIFKKVLYRNVPEAFGPMFEAYFRNAVLLLMDADGSTASLMDLDRVFCDAKYRRGLLERCKDHMIKRFWRDIATKAGGEAALENIVPYIVSKLTQFTGNPLIRPIISGPRSTLNFEKILTPGNIILVNLAKGSVGDADAALIGAIVTTRLFASILSRTSIAQKLRTPVRLYLDEFQTYTTGALGHMLAESRKFGLEMVLANQSLTQIDGRNGNNIADAILANVANILAFRIGPPDANALADWFTPEITPRQLTRMPDQYFAAKLLTDGHPQAPKIVRTHKH